MLLLVLDVLEAWYVVYMYNYFTTALYFPHFSDAYLAGFSVLRHGVDSKICGLGNAVGWLFGAFVLFRIFTPWDLRAANTTIVAGLFAGSALLNTNAFVYYVPVYLYELLRARYVSLPLRTR